MLITFLHNMAQLIFDIRNVMFALKGYLLKREHPLLFAQKDFTEFEIRRLSDNSEIIILI